MRWYLVVSRQDRINHLMEKCSRDWYYAQVGVSLPHPRPLPSTQLRVPGTLDLLDRYGNSW